MDKRVTRIYFIVVIIGFLYAIVASFSYRTNISSRAGDSGAITWEDEMEMTKEGNVYCYKTTLPRTDTAGKVIVYNTIHMCLEVQIDGKIVYELQPHEESIIKTTGFCWNVVILTERDAGKEIVFRVTPVYSDAKPQTEFFYGTYLDVEHKILGEKIFRLIVASMIALAGLVMLSYGFFVVRVGQVAEMVMHFAVFAMMLGIWSIGETQVLDWFFPCSVFLVFVSHVLLMVMPIPFVMFLRLMYHNGENKLWDFCCYLNCGVVIVRLSLQIMGLFDLRETLLLTHICLLLFVLIIIVMTIQEITENKMSMQIKINSICVIVILASTVMELGIYRISNHSTPLGSMGFLFYILVMGIQNVNKSRKSMEKAKEGEIYRKLAYTDELTGLLNRTAFTEDLDRRVETDKITQNDTILPTVIFMFDLNDLKKCNDTYGHDYGDQYIMMAADILKKIFVDDGGCYRIGGDEFCAWSSDVSQKKINAKLRVLEEQIKEQRRKDFVVKFSMAVGYAVYQEKEDANLYETMKRADTMMYERKQEYKRRVAQGLETNE